MQHLFMVQARLGVEFPQQHHDDDEKHDEIPMTQKFRADDAPQVVLVGKLAENGACRATHRVLEIDGIGEVDGHCKGVNHYENPLADVVICVVFLPVERKKHQYDVECVRIENGRRVEQESAKENV